MRGKFSQSMQSILVKVLQITLVVVLVLHTISVDLYAQDQAPFCFPSRGTLGWLYKQGSDENGMGGHDGADIWTGDWPQDSQLPGNPIFLPYDGKLEEVLQGRQYPGGPREGPVQLLQFSHTIDNSFQGLPSYSVRTTYIHLADESGNNSFVNPQLIGKKGQEFRAGTFLGYQGNRKFNRSGSSESVITHLHFEMSYDGVNDQEISPYLGYGLNFTADEKLSSGFSDFYTYCGPNLIAGNWGDGGVDEPGIHGFSGSNEYAPTGFTLCQSLDGQGKCTDPSTIFFGWFSDLPLVGNWNNDNFNDIGIFRPWGRSSPADQEASSFHLNVNGSVHVISTPEFSPSSLPLSGDWDGDGLDDLGLYEIATSTFSLYILDLSTNSLTLHKQVNFGDPSEGDRPLVGDWDGDGSDDIGVFRARFPNRSTNTFFLAQGQTNITAEQIQLGNEGDKPIIGDWDGDGDHNLAIFRPSSKQFFLRPDLPSNDVVDPPSGSPTLTAQFFSGLNIVTHISQQPLTISDFKGCEGKLGQPKEWDRTIKQWTQPSQMQPLGVYWVESSGDCTATITTELFTGTASANHGSAWYAISSHRTWNEVKGNCDLLNGPFVLQGGNENSLNWVSKSTSQTMDGLRAYASELSGNCSLGNLAIEFSDNSSFALPSSSLSTIGGGYPLASQGSVSEPACPPFCPPGVPILEVVGQSHLDFGSIAVGSSSPIFNLYLKNVGAGTLTGNLSVSSPFSIISGAQLNIEPGQSQTIGIRFSPTSASNFNRQISLGINAANTVLPTLSLSGTGVQGQLPPNQPTLPFPLDKAENVSINTQLSWSASDPNGDPLTYDLYFGFDIPLLVAANLNQTTFNTSDLNFNLSFETGYAWSVVVKDNNGGSTNGPVWRFTTEPSPALLPSKPVNISPSNNASNTSLTPMLVGNAFSAGAGITHSASRWQVRESFGTFEVPLWETHTFSDSLTSRVIPIGILSNNATYYWRVSYRGRDQNNDLIWSPWSDETQFSTLGAPTSGQTGLANTACPTYRCNMQRTGLTGNIGPNNPSQKWKISIGSGLEMPVIGFGGKLLLSDVRDNLLKKFSLQTGEIDNGFSALIGGIGGISSVTLRADGVIYVASSLETLSAATDSGATTIQLPLDGRADDSSPAIGADGTVYVVSNQGTLYFISPSGSVIRTKSLGAPAFTSPALSTDGIIYVLSLRTDTQNGKLHAFNADGSVRWVFDTGGRVLNQTSPAVAPDGTIYFVGRKTGDYGVFAVRPNGTEKWHTPLSDSGTTGSPAVGQDGTIYVTAGDLNLHALDPSDGSERWSFSLPSMPWGSPTVDAQGTIYASSELNLFAINSNGTQKWNIPLDGNVFSSPVIDEDGTLYITTTGNSLYAFETSAGPSEQFTLTVGAQGSGTVTSDDSNIDCGGNCSHTYDSGSTVVLTPTPSEGWSFLSWSGPTDCQDGEVTITTNITCIASFTVNSYNVQVNTDGDGIGSISFSPSGTSCGTNCATFNAGTQVTITATPNQGSVFGGWPNIGCDIVNGNQCINTINGSFTTTATFNLITNTDNSDKIVFESHRDGNREIYVMNADGTGQTRLTNNSGFDGNPSWSPDKSKIAFISDRVGNREVYVMDANGSNPTRLTNTSALEGNPRWSPDGAKIVFISVRDGNNEVYVMNANGSGQTRLTNNGAFEGDPSWSPDGTLIVFESERDGNREIYVMNPNGSGQNRLTNNSILDSNPDWSPDGTQIAFQSDRNSNRDVYVMDANGANQTRITTNSANDGDPSWSPNGNQLAFISDRHGNNEIFKMSASGGSETRLTNNSSLDADPDWASPVQISPPSNGFSLPFSDNFEDGTFDDWTIVKPTGTTDLGTIKQEIENDGTKVLSLEGGAASGGGNRLAINGPTTLTNYEISADVKIIESRNGGSHHGVVIRYEDADDFYQCMVGGGGASVVLIKRTASGNVDLDVRTPASFGWSVSLNQWFEIKVRVLGNRIQCLFDGLIAFDLTDSAHPQGAFGLSTAGAHNHFENINVKAITSIPAPPSSSSLIAEWKFDEASGTNSNDSSGNGHHGQLINGASFGAGVSGNALMLDGQNDYVQVPDHNDLDLSTFTIEGWFKFDAIKSGSSGNQGIVNKYRTDTPSESGYEIKIEQDNGDITIDIKDGSGTTTGARASTTPGVWHHFAETFDGSSSRLYLNGKLVSTEVKSLTLPGNSLALLIGALRNGASSVHRYFGGKIDELRIYNYALDLQQVEARCNANKPNTVTCGSGPPPDATTYKLTVTKTGDGTGLVTSVPTGIDCGDTCDKDFAKDATVTLVPQPHANMTFDGWGGDEDCSDGEVKMTQAITCVATFNPAAANPTSLTLSANDRSVIVGNSVTITALVRSNGNPVDDGTLVGFVTDRGTFSNGNTSINVFTTSGNASVKLTSQIAESATLLATVGAGNIQDTLTIFFNKSGVDATTIVDRTVNGDATATFGNLGVPGIEEVVVDSDSGNHTLTVAQFDDNPAEASFIASGGYYDVHLDNSDGINSVQVTFCPAEAGDLVYYWTGNSWAQASNQSYSDGCITVTITESTTPNLNDLEGQFFAIGLPAGGTAGGDPPIWGDIMIFPTPEKSLGVDLNGNGWVGDTVLRVQNIKTGEIYNTGESVSNRHKDTDIYENMIVFMEQTNYPMGVIMLHDLDTKETISTGALGHRPTIYGNYASISGTTVRYYDLEMNRLVETGIPGQSQAIWDGIIAFHRASHRAFHPTIRYYDIETGQVINTRAAGYSPVIYENLIVFTTDESQVNLDLNGDGDKGDMVIRYYDIETGKLTNTGQAGLYPSVFGNIIVFTHHREVMYFDTESHETFTTGQIGTEPDIYGDTITYYLWEHWASEDYNRDGDTNDPIVRTYSLITGGIEFATSDPVDTPLDLQPLSISKLAGYPNPVSLGQFATFKAEGEGIKEISVEVYDLAGQNVFASGFTPSKALQWNLLNNEGNYVANGVYLYIIYARGYQDDVIRSKIKKLVVLR